MKRTPYIPAEIKEVKRDTKNIVKNITKLFINWLATKYCNESEDSLQKIRQVVEENKFNNRLINILLKTEQFNKFFVPFLEKHAE